MKARSVNVVTRYFKAVPSNTFLWQFTRYILLETSPYPCVVLGIQGLQEMGIDYISDFSSTESLTFSMTPVKSAHTQFHSVKLFVIVIIVLKRYSSTYFLMHLVDVSFVATFKIRITTFNSCFYKPRLLDINLLCTFLFVHLASWTTVLFLDPPLNPGYHLTNWVSSVKNSLVLMLWVYIFRFCISTIICINFFKVKMIDWNYMLFV